MLKKLSLFAVCSLAILLVLFSHIQHAGALDSNISQGDLNNDGTVNILDLSILLENFGTNNSAADINGDGNIDILDLSKLLSDFGQNVTTPAPPPANLVPNPSLESAQDANTPSNWQSSSWGSNTASFSYADSGHTGSRSVEVRISGYSSGDAKWYFDPQKVTAGTEYTYSDYYKSDITSEVDAAFDMSDGSVVYEYIGAADPTTDWNEFTSNFSVPANAVDATVYHLIQGNGNLTIDDVSMQPYTPAGFNRPLLSIAFDDGIATQYTNGLPLLQKYNLSATFYIISGMLNTGEYMNDAQVQSLYADGEEIGSHTVSHPDLTTLTPQQVTGQLSQSQDTLQQLLGTGVQVKDFAAPYGMFNSVVTGQIKNYYQSDRGVEWGFNDKASFSPYDIKVEDVDINTTTAQIQGWISEAQATNTWLVLVYHAVDPNSTAIGQYDILPTELDSQLSAIKNSGIQVDTISQALSEVETQL